MKIKYLPGIAFIILASFAACNNPLLPDPNYEVTITALVENKVYDGTTSANIIDGELFGVFVGDNVFVINGTADFEDANIGTGKTVTFSGWSIGGKDAKKYKLKSQPESVKADITPSELMFELSHKIFTPLSGDNTATITFNGLPDSEMAVIKCNTVAGLTLNSEEKTLTYDGTTPFINPGLTLVFTVDAGRNYDTITEEITVFVYDGQEDYSNVKLDRRIPVTQDNIKAFNNYANSTEGTNKHYKLTENITLSGTNNWTAIKTFSGSFDGQEYTRGYTISNLVINIADDNQGMFGIIAVGGIVRNTGLKGGSVSGKQYVGGIAGENNGTIQYCYTTGNVRSGNNDLGGLVGINRGTGTIQNCYTTGNVGIEGINTNSNVGGIAGENYGTIQNCYTTGNIYGNSYVGGVAGRNSSGSKIYTCYAYGIVSGVNDYAGGIVGRNESGTVKKCVSINRSITMYNDSSYIGRVTGQNLSGTLTDNYARSMTITANSNPVSVTINPTGKDGGNAVDSDGHSYLSNQGFWFSNPMLWDVPDNIPFPPPSWGWSSSKELPILLGVGGQ